MIVRRVSPALLAFTTILTSCNKPEVQSYRVPKETVAQAPSAATPPPSQAAAGNAPSAPAAASPAVAGGTMAGTPVATASGPGLTWTAPSTWTPKTGSAMRKASFTISGNGGEADLSITAFPGDVGGDLANLNRWRSQVDLAPVTQAEFDVSTQRIERNGLRMVVVDIVGKGANAQSILGAMIPHGGATWFVKLMGPDALVAKEKAAFTAFLDTIKVAPAAK